MRSRISRVKAPVPGPNSTTVLALLKAQPRSIAFARAGELGTNEPTRAGSRKNAPRNSSRSTMAGSSLPRKPADDPRAPLERARA